MRALVMRCLHKDPRQRLRDIGDARIAIEEALASKEPEQPGLAASTAPAWRTPALLAGATLLGAAVTYGLSAAAARGPVESGFPFDRVIRLVASPAHEFSPAISPDGKWVAYLSNARGPTDIWLKSIAGGDPVNLTLNLDVVIQTEASIGGIDISPDGTELAFVGGPPGTPAGEISTYVMPVPLGGAPRRLIQARQGMRWSPDGKRIAYIKPGGAYGDSLFVADADGQNEREVVKHEGARHLHWPRWSSDGLHIYFNYGFQNGNSEPTQIFRVPAGGVSGTGRDHAEARGLSGAGPRRPRPVLRGEPGRRGHQPVSPRSRHRARSTSDLRHRRGPGPPRSRPTAVASSRR